MKGEDIEKLLRALPRQKASPEFTPRLLKRLAKPSSESTTAWLPTRPLLAGAAVLLLLGALTIGMRHWYELRERAEAAQRIETLRDEYETLEREARRDPLTGGGVPAGRGAG